MDVKIGDVVEVRKDLKVGNWYDGLHMFKSMTEEGGHVGRITEIDVDGKHFKIEGSYSWWNEETVNLKLKK